jgi:hypothetical protein
MLAWVQNLTNYGVPPAEVSQIRSVIDRLPVSVQSFLDYFNPGENPAIQAIKNNPTTALAVGGVVLTGAAVRGAVVYKKEVAEALANSMQTVATLLKSIGAWRTAQSASIAIKSARSAGIDTSVAPVDEYSIEKLEKAAVFVDRAYSDVTHATNTLKIEATPDAEAKAQIMLTKLTTAIERMLLLADKASIMSSRLVEEIAMRVEYGEVAAQELNMVLHEQKHRKTRRRKNKKGKKKGSSTRSGTSKKKASPRRNSPSMGRVQPPRAAKNRRTEGLSATARKLLRTG